MTNDGASGRVERFLGGTADFGEDEMGFVGLTPEAAGVGFEFGASAGDHTQEVPGFTRFLAANSDGFDKILLDTHSFIFTSSNGGGVVPSAKGTPRRALR